MVNYCAVVGCSRNSRTHNYLNYYGLPKDRKRQVEWLKAASRYDLLNGGLIAKSHRICSRHFLPSCIKSNKLLFSTAVPTLHLDGELTADAEDTKNEVHDSITCNRCKSNITGFRYKCVSCEDYDLCQKCEMYPHHAQHYMIRIPHPIKFADANKIAKAVNNLIMANNPSDETYHSTESQSSDDEPITNYLKRNHDEGIDLSEDVKQNIRKEVIKALSTNVTTTNVEIEIENKDFLVEYGATDIAVAVPNLNDLLCDYLKKNKTVQEVEFANVEESSNCLNTVKSEDHIVADNPMTSSSLMNDTLSEFLFKRS